MRIELSPAGVYATRILGLIAAQIAFAGGVLQLSLIGVGLALGVMLYWGDFKIRCETREGAILEPLACLASKEFWHQLAWTALLYMVIILGLGRLIGMKSSPGPVEWIALLTLINLASKNVRGYGFRKIRRI